MLLGSKEIEQMGETEKCFSMVNLSTSEYPDNTHSSLHSHPHAGTVQHSYGTVHGVTAHIFQNIPEGRRMCCIVPVLRSTEPFAVSVPV